MLEEEVSGKKKKRKTQVKLDNQNSSHIDHLQPFTCTAKLPTMGAVAGAVAAKALQIVMPYTRFLGVYMSAADAPPVARDGEPTKPVMKRNAMSMPKLFARAVGIRRRTKKNSVNQ